MPAPRFRNEFDLPAHILAYGTLVTSDVTVRSNQRFPLGARLLAQSAVTEYDYQLATGCPVEDAIPPVGETYPSSFWLIDVHERIAAYTARAIRNWLDGHYIGLHSVILSSSPPLDGEAILTFIEVSTKIPRAMIHRAIPPLISHLRSEDLAHCAFLGALEELEEMTFDHPHDPLVLNICHLAGRTTKYDIDFTVTRRTDCQNGAYIYSTIEP